MEPLARFLRKCKRFLVGLPASLVLGFDVLLFNPLLCLLPYGWAFPVTRWRGDLHFRLMKDLRARVLKDLGECLPERSAAERLAIARQVFQVQATFFYDSYLWTRYRTRIWPQRFATFRGREFLDASLAKGGGAILCTMHFHHYFYPGGFLLSLGYDVAPYAVWPSDMKKVNFFVKLHHTYIFRMSRWKSHARYIFSGRQQQGEIKRRLRENCVFYALLDIPLPEKQDLVPVAFLGGTALFPASLIHLQHQTGAPFHVLYAFRDEKDWRKQTVVITPELPLTGRVEEDLQLTVSELEKGIRQHPGFWWGWGLVGRMRPEHIRKVRERRDYSTRIRYGKREGEPGAE